MPKDPPIDLVRKYFRYDPETGSLIRLIDAGLRARAGTEAGWIDNKGYKRVSLEYRKHQVHRLAWALHYGEFPAQMIDHVNGDRADNRIENLRPANCSQNGANMLPRPSKTGVRGVRENGPGYCVSIVCKGTRHYLGQYRSIEDAKQVAEAAYKKFFGDYAPVSL